MKKKSVSKKPLVLDIGAGDNPRPEGTHAIDLLKAERPHPELEEYRAGNFNRPPKEWQGKFDKIVSDSGLGASDTLETPKTAAATAKALNFVTKPGATLKATVDVHQLENLMRILHASDFGVTRMTALEVPAWVPAFKKLTGDIVVEATKGYKGTAKEQRLVRKYNLSSSRFPIAFGGLKPAPVRPGVAYSDKGGQRLSRKHHRGFKRIKLS